MEKNQIDKINEARAHLAVSLTQAVPTDDQIIIGHIREASAILDSVVREARQ